MGQVIKDIEDASCIFPKVSRGLTEHLFNFTQPLSHNMIAIDCHIHLQLFKQWNQTVFNETINNKLVYILSYQWQRYHYYDHYQRVLLSFTRRTVMQKSVLQQNIISELGLAGFRLQLGWHLVFDFWVILGVRSQERFGFAVCKIQKRKRVTLAAFNLEKVATGHSHGTQDP